MFSRSLREVFARAARAAVRQRVLKATWLLFTTLGGPSTLTWMPFIVCSEAKANLLLFNFDLVEIWSFRANSAVRSG